MYTQNKRQDVSNTHTSLVKKRERSEGGYFLLGLWQTWLAEPLGLMVIVTQT